LNPGMDAITAYQLERRQKAIVLFVCLSLLLHLSVMFGLRYMNATTPAAPKVTYIDLNSPPPPLTDQETQTQKKQPKQIAESEESQDKSDPKDAKYLGERSQSVEEQTRAKTVDSFRKGGQATQAGNKGKSLSFKDLAPAKPAFTPPTPAEMDGYRKQEMAKNMESGKVGSQQLDNLGSASNDYIKDAKDGDRTMLNTKEFVYFSYYRRIRQKLEVAWNSRLRSTLDGYVYGGRKLANREYVTGVIVVLDRHGSITRVQVLQQSGARDLDQAAVDAFNSAGPFPDPPAGIVDENGEIQIPWNFILQS
jgi:TonB family protein